MLRRTQTVTLDPQAEAGEAPQAEAERPSMPRARPNFDEIRADIQRNFAAHMDLGTPDPAPSAPAPEAERLHVSPKIERRRVENLRAEVQKNATFQVERRRPFGNLRVTPARLALLVVALFAGGLAAYLATQHDQSAPVAAVAAVPAEPAPVPKVQVLVAKQAIEMGQRLSASSIGWEDWPQDALKPEYVTAGLAPQALTDMSGSVARSEILAGEPIRKERLAPPGSGYLSAMLGNGMRGVSVNVAADSASGGFVVPNDHVDVVLTRTINGAQNSETIMRDVRVLGINAKLGQTAPAAAPANAADAASEAFTGQAITTLELTPAQADVMIDASGLGKLSLVLRPTGEAAETGTAAERAANAAIRLSSPFWAKP